MKRRISKKKKWHSIKLDRTVFDEDIESFHNFDIEREFNINKRMEREDDSFDATDCFKYFD